MVSIQVIAFILLVARVGSAFYISRVIVRQYQLLQTPIPTQLEVIAKSLKRYRVTLFLLSLAILAGNLVPIYIDALTMFKDTDRPENIAPISIIYAFSNALTSFISSFLIYQLYKVAKNDEEITNLTAQAVASKGAK